MRLPGMLRLFLLDGLVDKVNKEFRLKITFKVGRAMRVRREPDGSLGSSQLLFGSVADSFDPEIAALDTLLPEDQRQPRTINRDQLFTEVLLVASGSYVTVKELIENLGYVHGLIHPGEPKTLKDAAILEWRRNLQLGGTGAGLREIRSVGRVVHRALIPLRDAVLAKYA